MSVDNRLALVYLKLKELCPKYTIKYTTFITINYKNLKYIIYTYKNDDQLSIFKQIHDSIDILLEFLQLNNINYNLGTSGLRISIQSHYYKGLVYYNNEELIEFLKQELQLYPKVVNF